MQNYPLYRITIQYNYANKLFTDDSQNSQKERTLADKYGTYFTSLTLFVVDVCLCTGKVPPGLDGL